MRLLCAALLLSLAAGCGSSTSDDDSARSPERERPPCSPSTDVEGGQDCAVDGRTYTVVRPPGAGDEPTVVLVLHGVGGPAATRAAVAEISGLHEGADEVVVYPEAQDGAWIDSDVEHFRAILRREKAARAAIVGWSGSGFVAHQAGCEDAVDVVAVLHAPVLSSCTPSRPVSVLQLAGTDDRFIPFEGGGTPDGRDAPPMRRAMRTWRRALGCEPVERSRPSSAVTVERSACRDGARVELRAIQGGGHVWFGPDEAPPDDAVDATLLIRSFIAAR